MITHKATHRRLINLIQPTPPGLIWEMPLGTVRDRLFEPEGGFVDPYDAEERAAIQSEEPINEHRPQAPDKGRDSETIQTDQGWLAPT